MNEWTIAEKIQNMKKAAKCGNKAKQKETASEIERLEKEQTDRHKKEIEQVWQGREEGFL